MPSSERWKRKKAGLNPTDEELEAKANVTKLTELADSILQNTGNMDVYQETYEYITEKLNASTSQSSSSSSPSTSRAEIKAAELDMYADDFDEKEKVRLETNVTSTEDMLKKTSKVSETCSSATDVMWEFKWTKDNELISGPHTTEQMNEWSKTDYFKGEVWVRKCGVESDFHSSKRIDFELYM